MVEADEQAFAAPASGGVSTPGGGDPALHALHAKLRVDYRAWEESPIDVLKEHGEFCLLYTSPSPRDATLSRMPSSA